MPLLAGNFPPQSCSTDMMTAVEERTKQAPAMKATGREMPKTTMPVTISAKVAETTCTCPKPKV